MSFARKMGENYYVCHRPLLARNRVKSGRYMDKDFKNWWLIKFTNNSGCGYLSLGKVVVPKELVGKRVRIKIEEIKEEGEDSGI